MSDERDRVRRQEVLGWVAIGAVLLVVVVIVAFVAYGQVRLAHALREFGMLWKHKNCGAGDVGRGNEETNGLSAL